MCVLLNMWRREPMRHRMTWAALLKLRYGRRAWLLQHLSQLVVEARAQRMQHASVNALPRRRVGSCGGGAEGVSQGGVELVCEAEGRGREEGDLNWFGVLLRGGPPGVQLQA
jgi:hypothetical protein